MTRHGGILCAERFLVQTTVCVLCVPCGFHFVLPVRLHVFALGMLLAVLVSNRWSGAPQAMLSRAGQFPGLWWLCALAAYLATPLVLGVLVTHPQSHTQAIGNDICRALVGLFLVIPAVLGAEEGGVVVARDADDDPLVPA